MRISGAVRGPSRTALGSLVLCALVFKILGELRVRSGAAAWACCTGAGGGVGKAAAGDRVLWRGWAPP